MKGLNVHGRGIVYLIVSLFFVFTLPLILGCGGGGGDSAPATTAITGTDQPAPAPSEPPASPPPATTTPAPTPAPSSDALFGNFKFVYQIISIWTDKVTLNTKSNTKSPEGTDVYTGYDADYPSVTVSVGYWSPSISQYAIATVPTYASIYDEAYIFKINSDNTLSGCHFLLVNDVPYDCDSLIIPASHKTPLGTWDMTQESENTEQEITTRYEKMTNEKLVLQGQQQESACKINENLLMLFKDLKAIAGRSW